MAAGAAGEIGGTSSQPLYPFGSDVYIMKNNAGESTPRTPTVDTSSGRRRFLRFLGVASLPALAGCAQSDGEAEVSGAAGRPDEWCVEENDVEVHPAYETAESIDGIERDPSELNTREEAAYQCHPQGFQLCANCRFFIPSKPGDTGEQSGHGACAIVEGVVRSRDWCALYQETERLEEFPHPEPHAEPGPNQVPNP